MKYSELKNTLKKHSLRITDCRMDVLELFTKTDHALSFKALESELDVYDRVTLYRTLHSFIEKGVLHRIPDDSGFASYGICHETCTPQEHSHDHVHFKCDECGHIECLSDHHVPKVVIPGYVVNEANLIVSGLCNSCNA
ncbi:MAG: transcriptional repressor [Cyclobacteriaceae bacterium]